MRPLRALLLALGVLALAGALAAPLAPPYDPDPLPYRNPPAVRWIDEVRPGLFLTLTGEAIRAEGAPFRILMLGSSAMRGDGATRFQSLPGRLQALLDRQGRPVEVVNAGVAGTDSGTQLSVLREGLDRLRPDLVVVYSGNNEFLRLRAYRSANSAWTPRLERVRHALERWPLYRWLAAGAGAAGGMEGVPVEDLPAKVTADDVALARGYYRANLEQMAALCRERGVPLVLSVVAANETTPPEYGAPPREEPDLAQLEAELRRDPDSAWLQYRWGMAVLGTGRTAEAAAALRRAMELDPEPGRAMPSFAEEVRGVPGVRVLDAPALLRGAFGEVPGDAAFMDFCHLKPAANEVLAEALASLVEDLLPATGTPLRSAADPLDLEAFDRFRGRVHHPELGERPVPGSEWELREALPPAGTPEGEALRGHLEFLHERGAQAAEHYRDPRTAVGWRNLGHALMLDRRVDEALAAYGRFLELGGRDPRLERLVEASGRSGSTQPERASGERSAWRE